MHEKTGGNPFFAIQFISALAEEGLLTFQHDHGRWSWNLNRIHAKSYTDNVVDLMVWKLQCLPVQTQEALRHFACLGTVADVETLSIVLEIRAEEVQASLWEAVLQELVVPLKPFTPTRLPGAELSTTATLHSSGCEHGDSIELAEVLPNVEALASSASSSLSSEVGSTIQVPPGNAYRFIHDRIQEAAYALIPQELRAETHLRIGRLLKAHTPAQKREEAIFEIVNQLSRGAVLITAQDEREQLAELNLMAGKRAKASTAYASALKYLSAGAALLAGDCWQRRYQLTLGLWLERAECEYLNGNFEKAEELIEELLRRAASKIDRAMAYRLQILVHMMRAEYRQALNTGLECLRQFGIYMSAHPSRNQVQAEYEKVWLNLGSRSIESLVDLPPVTDPEKQATIQLLSVLSPPAFFTDSNLFYLIVYKMANASLQYGTTYASVHGFADLGSILGPVFHRYGEGYRFAKLAFSLVEKYGFHIYRARAYFNMERVGLWTQPIRTVIDFVRLAFDICHETHDLAYACYCCNHLVTDLLLQGVHLEEVWREAQKGLEFVRKVKYRDVADVIVSQQRFILNLLGRTAAFSTFSDAEFDEEGFETQLTDDRMPNMVCWYWILKLQARFLSGDYEAASTAAERARALLWSTETFIESANYCFYHALTIAALADRSHQQIDTLNRYLERLREWAENCPANFENRAALVAAEIARIEARVPDAEVLYEQAIRSAHENGFVHNEALANELAARFYATRGFEKIARVYLKEARYGYLRWGAIGKVQQLDRLHSYLRPQEQTAAPTTTIGAPVEQLDLATVLKVSQAVSGEIVLENLIDTLMRTAIEYAGAERGLLILPHGEEHRIAAEARTGRDGVEVQVQHALVTPSDLPDSLLRYVIRTLEVVILDDGSVQNLFSEDEYLRQRRSRSILCLPLVKQARLMGVLYLENNLAPRVFTPERLAMLELLASEAAISLDNARLYADLAQENSDRRRAEEALRASEERWRKLFENSSAGIALVTPDGRFIAANLALQKMLGYTEEELQRLTALELTLEEDRATSEAVLAEAAEGQRRNYRIEKRYRCKDGNVIWTDLSSTLVPATGSTPAFFAGVVVDITERKQAEEMRAAMARERESFAKQRATELAKANEALRGCLDTLASVPELDAFLGQVMAAITRQLDAVSSSLRMLNLEENTLTLELVFQDGRVISPAEASYPESSRSLSPDERRVATFLDQPTTVIHVLDPQSPIVEEQRSYLLGLGIKTLLIIPLSSGGQINGRLDFRFNEERTFNAEELEIARALATQASLAIHLTRLAKTARQSAVLEERNRLAGEIHDSLAQSFTAISMQLAVVEEEMAAKEDSLLRNVRRANEMAKFGLTQARRSILGLRSSAIQDSGLTTTLQRLVERSNVAGRVRCDFRSDNIPEECLPATVQHQLLRIAQEAISNAIRHAKPTVVTVTLRWDTANLILQVKDNGSGISSDRLDKSDGVGMGSMRDRAAQIGARLEIQTATGRGTSIIVTVPISSVGVRSRFP